MKRKSKNPAAVTLGRLGGLARAKALTDSEREEAARRAGEARAEKLSASERSRIARKAVAAREAKRRAARKKGGAK